MSPYLLICLSDCALALDVIGILVNGTPAEVSFMLASLVFGLGVSLL